MGKLVFVGKYEFENLDVCIDEILSSSVGRELEAKKERTHYRASANLATGAS